VCIVFVNRLTQGVFGNDDRFDPIGQTAEKRVR
jgi:hypothetical protein